MLLKHASGVHEGGTVEVVVGGVGIVDVVVPVVPPVFSLELVLDVELVEGTLVVPPVF